MRLLYSQLFSVASSFNIVECSDEYFRYRFSYSNFQFVPIRLHQLRFFFRVLFLWIYSKLKSNLLIETWEITYIVSKNSFHKSTFKVWLLDIVNLFVLSLIIHASYIGPSLCTASSKAILLIRRSILPSFDTLASRLSKVERSFYLGVLLLSAYPFCHLIHASLSKL